MWNYSDPVFFSLSLWDSYVVYAKSINLKLRGQGLDQELYSITPLFMHGGQMSQSLEPRDEDKSTDKKPDETQLKFNVNDHHKALGYILSTIDTDLSEEVSELKLAALIMRKLQDIMQDISKPTKVWWKVQFTQQKRGNDSPLIFLKRLIDVRRKVINAGGTLPEYDLVIHFMGNVGKEYDPIMMVYYQKDESDLTIALMEKVFLNEKARSMVRDSSDGTNPSSVPQEKALSLTSKNICHRCGLVGHKQETCRSPDWKVDQFK